MCSKDCRLPRSSVAPVLHFGVKIVTTATTGVYKDEKNVVFLIHSIRFQIAVVSAPGPGSPETHPACGKTIGYLAGSLNKSP